MRASGVPLTARFDVFLNNEGRVIAATLADSSCDSGLDAAIRAAIMKSAPFPPETGRSFPITVSTAPAGDDRQP